MKLNKEPKVLVVCSSYSLKTAYEILDGLSSFADGRLLGDSREDWKEPLSAFYSAIEDIDFAVVVQTRDDPDTHIQVLTLLTGLVIGRFTLKRVFIVSETGVNLHADLGGLYLIRFQRGQNKNVIGPPITEACYKIRDAIEEQGKATSGVTGIFGVPRFDLRWTDIVVLMPFTSDLKTVYDHSIKVVAGKLKLTVSRGDDFFSTSTVMLDVWSMINYADIIIADCTGRNPNVFYEIGLAHTLGKDTILITQSIDDIPFNLQHLRIIPYSNTETGRHELQAALEIAIQVSLL